MPDKKNIEDQTQVLMQIGALLKETRETKGLTLEAAQEETKIRRHYLEALEQGKRNVLPGEVYLKGFLKNYACYLGLPGEEVVRHYSQSQREHDDTNTRSEPKRVRRDMSWKRNLHFRTVLLAALLVLLVTVSFVLTKGFPRQDLSPDESHLSDNQSSLPSSPSTPHSRPDPEEVILPEDRVQTVLNTPSELIYQVDGPPQLKLEVTDDRCWIAVRTDDSDEISETVPIGNYRTLTATSKIWLRVGNPSVVDLTVNGVHMGAAGAPGQPRNITIERLP